MASIWQEFIDTLDGQLSGDPKRKWMDVKPLMGLPLFPGFVIVACMPTASIAAKTAMTITFVVELAWLILIFKRWKVKAAAFTPATRFSDDPAGY
ncbi:hypothetical protein ACH0BU_17080 [Sphingomonas olei]